MYEIDQNLEELPFFSLDNHQIIKLSFNSNSSCLCSKKINKSLIDILPRLEFVSSLRNTLNTNEFDTEVNLFPEVDFNFYTCHEFHSSQLIRDSIS